MKDAPSSNISESAHSPTAEFGQRNASIWLRSQKQGVKNVCLQNCNLAVVKMYLLQVLMYAAVQPLEKYYGFF